MDRTDSTKIVELDGTRGRLPQRPQRRVAISPALTLLGGFLLQVGDEVVEMPAGAQRLVAVLALRGRLSRSRLAGMLWPETTEHRALASLRTGIWRVNQSVDRLVNTTGATVDLASDVDVDVRRLIQAARSSLREDDGSEMAAAFAVFDDGGDLLPDWDDEWLLADRERLRQVRLHVLEDMAAHLAATGRYGLALEAALAALRADMLRESAHRTVIGVHLAEGNVAEARRAFNLCRQVLVNDVGVEPSATTVAMLPAMARGPVPPKVAVHA